MKIPKKIKVGGHVYDVNDSYVFVENSLSGQADYENSEIRVASLGQNGKPKARSFIEQTFIHEVLHVIAVVYNGEGLPEDVNERISQGIYQVFNDNGLLKEE